MLGIAGCGDPPPASPAVSAPAPPSAAALRARAASGIYAVSGVTVQAQTGRQREISGQLELRVEGDRYEVNFELSTTAPDATGEVPVVVRGSGRGFVVGGVLTGTTEDWMTLATDAETLADVDLDVTLPANAGLKIVSSSQASVDAEGGLEIVLQNQPPPDGPPYDPSVTVLAGQRIPSD
jgi:hypothetical protein